MGAYKQDRTAEDIKRETAAVIRELKDLGILFQEKRGVYYAK